MGEMITKPYIEMTLEEKKEIAQNIDKLDKEEFENFVPLLFEDALESAIICNSNDGARYWAGIVARWEDMYSISQGIMSDGVAEMLGKNLRKAPEYKYYFAKVSDDKVAVQNIYRDNIVGAIKEASQCLSAQISYKNLTMNQMINEEAQVTMLRNRIQQELKKDDDDITPDVVALWMAQIALCNKQLKALKERQAEIIAEQKAEQAKAEQ